MKNVTNVVSVIIGTIIGGGFISGQEIYIFFNKYDKAGLLGIFIAILSISFIIYKTYKITKEKDIRNYEEFLNKIIPGENIILKEIIKNIINIFLVLSFFIMCNAFSTYCYEIYKVPKLFGGILVAILNYIVLTKDVKAIIKTNAILMPLTILFIIVMAVLFLKKADISFFIEGKAIAKGILYVNYNCITIIPIVVNLKDQIKNKKQMKIIALATFIIMLFLSFLIFEMQGNIKLENLEMPLLIIAKQISIWGLLTYGIITQASIFTSAISTGYSFICNFKKNKKIIVFILCFISIPFSFFNFSNLIKLIYPVFGVLGSLQIFFLIKG